MVKKYQRTNEGWNLLKEKVGEQQMGKLNRVLKIGDIVRHPLFGSGTVNRVKSSRLDSEPGLIDVEFYSGIMDHKHTVSVKASDVREEGEGGKEPSKPELKLERGAKVIYQGEKDQIHSIHPDGRVLLVSGKTANKAQLQLEHEKSKREEYGVSNKRSKDGSVMRPDPSGGWYRADAKTGKKIQSKNMTFEDVLADKEGKQIIEGIEGLDPKRKDHQSLYKDYQKQLKDKFGFDYKDTDWDK
jgi:hypothetical protein